jgi:hypothetical protein
MGFEDKECIYPVDGVEAVGKREVIFLINFPGVGDE